MFTTVVLVTGPLWARPVWGTWWTWDARLTLTLFLWFIYVGYLVLRGAIEDPSLRARYSAVLGILGSLLIPFIHLSVYLFRTLHPRPIVIKPSAPSLPPEMLTTLVDFVRRVHAVLSRPRSAALSARHRARHARVRGGALMPHNENYYYAAYFAALGIYMLYTISIMRRRLTIARRRLALRRDG